MVNSREPNPIFTPRDGVWAQIEAERLRQEKRWSHEHDMAHTDVDWLVIAFQWLGKVLDARLEDKSVFMVQKRVVQTAAVLVAWAEASEARSLQAAKGKTSDE